MTVLHADLGALSGPVAETTARLEREQIAARIARDDYTVWSPAPTEISNRLGWLTIAARMGDALPEIHRVVGDVRMAGYTDALLLGMGGSSLAPEVFRETFGVAPGYLDLAVLDSTDPDAVRAQASRLDPGRTLFIVSTRSGGTVETFSFFRYFFRRAVHALGAAEAGQHFIAITDPGSALADTAARHLFRATFLNDPNIGGRYSALSHFGLVPASLTGADVPRLLARATAASRDPATAARLGVILGEAAAHGRDKATFAISPGVRAFGSWVEQLLAESTGKDGKGILPVVDEPLGPPSVYGADRLFIDIRLAGDTTHESAVRALREAGHPVVRLDIADPYDIGGQFFTWEMATAVAGWRLGINPFDQPNVESAKVVARELVSAYEKTGSLPALESTAHDDALTVYASPQAGARSAGAGPDGAAGIVRGFLRGVRPGDYVAIQAFVQPTPATTDAMQALRVAIRDHLQVATTAGYGPRYLHSTGQLHKGDGGRGVFLQLVTPPPPPARDIPIPMSEDADASGISFGVLKLAQALGDRKALLDRGRRVLRVDPARVPQDIARIAALVP